MLAAVTGATGCVGRNLVDALLRDGWKVIALHRGRHMLRLAECDCQLQRIDLQNAIDLPRNIDCVFHCAANLSHWRHDRREQYECNVIGTRNLLRASSDAGVRRFVFTSTAATNGQYTGNNYVETKRLAEQEVLRSGLDVVVIQPCIVVGRYDWNNYSQIFSRIKAGTLRFAFPGHTVFCHASDVAQAHVQAAKTGRSGERYVLGGTWTTWLDFMRRVAEVVGGQAPSRVLPRWRLMFLSYACVMVAACSGKRPLITPDLVSLLRDSPGLGVEEVQKSKADLGYELGTLDAAIRDCHEWMMAVQAFGVDDVTVT